MKLLVCGGAGYIGSQLCKMLAERGDTVHVLDDLSTGHREAVRWGELHVGDIGDTAFVREVLDQAQPDGVFHFAAKSLVGESVSDPALYYRNNVAGTLVLLEALRERPCPLVFSSTAAIFGEPDTPRIDENHPTLPINPYGRSKLMVERILDDYWCAYGLPSACLRYFNAAGADPAGEIGEAHTPETHLIPLVLEAALDGNKTLRVFGDDYPTPDGSCVRDYIHIGDLCDAHLLALEQIMQAPAALRYNLGNGDGYSVKQVLRAAESVVGHAIPHRVEARRPGDPPQLVADASRARVELGWRPHYPELESIIETAWRWHRNRSY